MSTELINKYVETYYRVDDPDKFGDAHLEICTTNDCISSIKYFPSEDSPGGMFKITSPDETTLNILVELLKSFKI